MMQAPNQSTHMLKVALVWAMESKVYVLEVRKNKCETLLVKKKEDTEALTCVMM